MNDPMSGIFQGFEIASAGLRAEATRAEVASTNLANMHSTGNASRLPYKRKQVVFEEVLEQSRRRSDVSGGELLARGSRVARVEEDEVSEFPRFQNPGHRDADAEGWVWTSNVDVFRELVDLSVAERSYAANLAAMRIYKSMMQNTVTNMRQ